MPSSVLALLYPGCIFFELALALELLAKKYHIIFATPDGSDHKASNGATIKAHCSYQAVELQNCKAILVPGGDPGSIKDNQAVEAILQQANERKLCIAAICAGPFVLAKSGILKGRKIAHGYETEQLNFLSRYFEGVELTNEAWLWDQHIITAQPDAHIDFAVEIAGLLGAIESAKIQSTKDYYRGQS